MPKGHVTPTMTVKAVDKETRTVTGQVPDASWLETFERIKTAFNAHGHIGSSTNVNYDAADADITARFQLAYYVGPRLAAQQTLRGNALERELETIEKEYRVLLNAVSESTPSFVIGNRGCAVKVAKDGNLLRTSIDAFAADKKTEERLSRL